MLVVKNTLIPLIPEAFKCIFKLLKLNRCLKIMEANSFLVSQARGMNIIQEFIFPSSEVPYVLFVLDISLFR